MSDPLNVIQITDANRAAVTEKLQAAGLSQEKINSILADNAVQLNEINNINNLTLESLNVVGTEVQRQNNSAGTPAAVQSSFSAQEAGFSEDQIKYLVDAKIISQKGDVCTFLEGKSAEDLQRVLQKHKTDTFLRENTASTPTEEETITDSDSNYKLNITSVEEVDNGFGAPKEEELKNADLESRSVRRKYKKEFKASLEKWLADDPSNVDEMNNSIAEKYYAKDIEKKYKKLAKKPENEPYLLVQNYMNTLPEDDELKVMYKNLLANGKEALTAEDSKLTPELKKMRQGIMNLMDASNTQKLSNITSNENVLNRAITEYAIAALKKEGINLVDGLLYDQAKNEVLNARSKDEVENDKKKYLKYMSKREVEYFRDDNRINRTVCCYSKEEYKNLKKNGDPNMRYVYIGKYAKKMVENRPELFCDLVTDGGAFDIETKKGEKYKFNSEKYKAAIGDWFDNTAEGSDGGNHHATLSEVRRVTANSKFFDETDDNRGTLEDLYGNGNGHVGYWEGRRTRNIIKSTGRSVDKDRTNWKIAGKTLEKSAVTFALAAIPGAIAAKGVKTVLDVAGHVVSIPSQIVTLGNKTVEIPSTEVKTTDTTTTIIDGESFTNGTTHTTNVLPDHVLIGGKEVPVVDGKVTIDGQSYDLKDYINELEVDGNKVKLDNEGNLVIEGAHKSQKINMVKQGIKTGAWAALMMLPANFISSLDEMDPGDTEDRVNLYIKKQVSRKEEMDVLLKGTKLTKKLDTKYDGWSVDEGVLKRNGVKDYTQTTQLGTGGKVKAQAVYASYGISVTPTVNDNGVNDFAKPATITLKDKTNNGKVHTFTYQLVTSDEAQAYGLSDVTKPLYKLISVTDENGQNIRNANSPDEVYRLELDELAQPTKTFLQDSTTGDWTCTFNLNYKYNLKQDDPKYPGYNKTSMDYLHHSNYLNKRH